MQPSAVAQSPAAPIDEMKEFLSATEGTWEPVRDANRPRKYVETMKFIPILDGRLETSQQILRNQDRKIVYRDFVIFGVDPDTHKLFLAAYSTDGSIDRTHQIESRSGQWVSGNGLRLSTIPRISLHHDATRRRPSPDSRGAFERRKVRKALGRYLRAHIEN